MKKVAALAALACLVVMFAASAALAHRCMVFAFVEGDTVFVEAGFASGNPARDCLVTATSAAGDEIASGKTDDEGMFEFTLPEGLSGDITLNLYAGEGHAADWTVQESEYR